jgi:hypothetical protein
LEYFVPYRNSIGWPAALRAGNQAAKNEMKVTVDITNRKSEAWSFTGK